jgi:hypothetical protein
LVGAAFAVAAEKEKAAMGESAKALAGQAEHAQQSPYLGVGIESLPAALVSHLPKTFRNGQGVLVAEVASGSPAEKAGIQRQDILMTYNDQKLFSPEQLAKLVKADSVGDKVALNLIREGKPLHVKLALGEHVMRQTPTSGRQFATPWPWNWPLPAWQAPQQHAKATAPADEDVRWQSFDSMTIKNLGKDRFKAEIRYLDKDGKLQTREFEGTRQEIDEAVAAHKDLPNIERQHLLRGLDMPIGELAFPRVRVTPGQRLSWQFDEPDWVF